VSVPIAEEDRVVVTGAAGFIGSAVVRALLARGASVVALVEPGGDERNLAGLDVERRTLDIRDGDALSAVVDGARFIFRLAAMYQFWARRPEDFYDVNVGGTLNVLEAARRGVVERVVYTSTVGVLGLGDTARGIPADETSYADVAHLFGLYKRTKYVAEHEVLRAAGQGLPVSLVLPTFPIGPGDSRPTPTGKVVVEFLNGRMPAFVDTTFNVVHVDDLAAGAASQLVEGRLLRREPSVALEAARMSTTNMMFSTVRAREELGYAPRPTAQAVADSVRWFVDNGYVTPKRRERMTLVS
jgi:dihydroflavonol-4-reductase